MKKFKYLILLFVLCGGGNQMLSIKAESNEKSIVATTYEHGLRVETRIVEDEILSRSAQKSGTKTVNYYNGNTLLWSVNVHGTFTYNGTSSSCTSSTVSAYSNHADWKISNKSARKTGNKAYASATGKRYYLGMVMQTVTREVSLTCSSNGKLS